MDTTGSSPPALSHPAEVRDTYSYKTLLVEIADDDEFWKSFRYLPGVDTLKFEKNTHMDPRYGNNPGKKMKIATIMSARGAREKIIWAHVASKKVTQGVSSTVKFYFTGGKRVVQEELRFAKFIEPFGSVGTAKGTHFADRIAALTLFYFLEQGIVDTFNLSRKELVWLRKACREVAEASELKGLKPCRERKATEEAMGTGMRNEMWITDSFHNSPPPHVAQDINNTLIFASQNDAHSGTQADWTSSSKPTIQRPSRSHSAYTSLGLSTPRLCHVTTTPTEASDPWCEEHEHTETETENADEAGLIATSTPNWTDNHMPMSGIDDCKSASVSRSHLKRGLVDHENHYGISKRVKLCDNSTQTDENTWCTSARANYLAEIYEAELESLRSQNSALTSMVAEAKATLVKHQEEAGQRYALYETQIGRIKEGVMNERSVRSEEEAQIKVEND